MKIRVLLVEDQKIMQKYFASMVQGDERFLLVDVLNDGEKAVSYCNHTVVDLVLMDVQTFQNHDGLLAAETIKKQHPAVKIIVITSLVDPEILTRAKEKGADSLWYKDSTKERLMECIRQTMEGGHVFPDAPPVVRVGLADSTEFTKTELKVLRYLVRGMSYTRIAAELGCEMSTVKFHVANMLQKTGLQNKLQLALAVSDVKLIADLAGE